MLDICELYGACLYNRLLIEKFVPSFNHRYTILNSGNRLHTIKYVSITFLNARQTFTQKAYYIIALEKLYY